MGRVPAWPPLAEFCSSSTVNAALMRARTRRRSVARATADNQTGQVDEVDALEDSGRTPVGRPQCGSNQFPPVGRDGIQYIVNLACESDFGHRQGEARSLLDCRPRRHG